MGIEFKARGVRGTYSVKTHTSTGRYPTGYPGRLEGLFGVLSVFFTAVIVWK